MLADQTLQVQEEREASTHNVAAQAGLYVVGLLVGLLMGLAMLALYLLALAWDPMDRRLGLHTRRLRQRREGLGGIPAEARTALPAAVGVLPSASGDEH